MAGIRCPYVTNVVWCNERESVNAPTYACDSCSVLWGDCWNGEKE